MIGWENNQGAYFIQKLEEKINDLYDKLDDADSAITELTDDMGEVETAVTALTAQSLKKKTLTGTTSSSGALQLPFNLTDFDLIGTRCTSATNTFAFARGSDPYITVFKVDNNVMTVLKSTEVTFELYYCNAKNTDNL